MLFKCIAYTNKSKFVIHGGLGVFNTLNIRVSKYYLVFQKYKKNDIKKINLIFFISKTTLIENILLAKNE